MKHLGDITKINGAEIPIVDVIVGGSPCQDLSVAGKREGLKGQRSSLFLEQIRIIKEMRLHDRRTNQRTGQFVRPRIGIWENVPGALSSPGKGHRGEDFQAVLTEFVRIVNEDAPIVPLPKDGKWPKGGCIMGYGSDGTPFSIAWRVHDGQFWGSTYYDDDGIPLWLGTPQRRKRIALVADFGGVCASEVCFIRKGLCWNPTESGNQREEVAGDIAESVGETDGK